MAPSKSNVEKWIKQTAKNDSKYGRDSKSNPNNQPKSGKGYSWGKKGK